MSKVFRHPTPPVRSQPLLGTITECAMVITLGFSDLANKNTGHPVKFAMDILILKIIHCLYEIQVYLSVLYLSGNYTTPS